MEQQNKKRPSATTILFTTRELAHLDKLTEEVNGLADLPRRISRGHIVRAIIAIAKNVSAERILKNLQF
jgi:hypothetical protein